MYLTALVDVQEYDVEFGGSYFTGFDVVINDIKHKIPRKNAKMLGQFNIIAQKLISETANEYSVELAWKDIPISKVNKIIADRKIKILISDYPFQPSKLTLEITKAKTYEERLATKQMKDTDWFSIQQNLLAYYQKIGKWREAAKIAGLMFDAFPNQHNPAYVAGQLYFKVKDFTIALYYHSKAIELAPDNVSYLMSLARTYYANDKPTQSITILKKVLTISPTHPQAIFQLQRLEEGTSE